MKLNIIGYKNLTDEQLNATAELINSAVTEIKYGNPIREALRDLGYQLTRETNKRKNSSLVWVEFIAEWSGYSSSQKKQTGVFYKKLHRTTAERLPKYYQHNFSDGTTNDWHVKIVSVKGKDSGSYKDQIDDIINSSF